MCLYVLLQELIEVESDIVFELASYILQVRYKHLVAKIM